MSIISGSINIESRQILIPCDIAVAGSVNIALGTIDKDSIESKRTMALFDTGATATCVSSFLAREMNLNHDGLSQTTTAGGVIQSKLYMIDLILNFVDHYVPIESLRVCEITLSRDSPFQVLLGMDVILKGHLSISRDGHVLFAL